MAHDVFICHSSKDRTIANAICSTLEQHRIRCWIAPRDVLPGSDYGGAIIEAISTTRLTVLVFSSNSNESPHVRREIERTISHGIPVLPFRVEEVTPSPALEYFISDAHWLDAMTPPLEQHLDHLVGTVRLLLDRETARAAEGRDTSRTVGPVAVPAGKATEGDRGQAPTVATPVLALPVTARPRVPSPPILAGVGLAAIAVLAVGAFLLTGSGRPSASQTALSSASAAPSSSPGQTAGPAASRSLAPATASPSAEPGAGEAIARIKAAVRSALSCDPPEAAAPGDVDSASMFCYVGDGTVGSVVYTLYPTLDALRSDYGAWLDYYGLALGTKGSCAKGERVEAAWSFDATPSVTEGHYFCVVDDEKVPNLYWTDEATLILVNIDGDTNTTLAQLYPIWRANTYDPVRP